MPDLSPTDRSDSDLDRQPIHWAVTPAGICRKKDSKENERTVELSSGGSITYMAAASFIENVTCTVCACYATQVGHVACCDLYEEEI